MLEEVSEHIRVIPAKGSWGGRDGTIDRGKNVTIVLKEWEQNMCVRWGPRLLMAPSELRDWGIR